MGARGEGEVRMGYLACEVGTGLLDGDGAAGDADAPGGGQLVAVEEALGNGVEDPAGVLDAHIELVPRKCIQRPRSAAWQPRERVMKGRDERQQEGPTGC